jgi:hypothetical protein
MIGAISTPQDLYNYILPLFNESLEEKEPVAVCSEGMQG